VLAMEDRESGCRAKASYLEAIYSPHFYDMMSTYHPADMPGEIKGKSSNTSWAFREFKFRMESNSTFSPDNTTITIMDADSFVHKKFFSCLNYKFLKSDEKEATIWQSPVVNYKNYYSVPVLTRCTSVTVSMHELGCLNNPIGANPMFLKLPFSTYALSYSLANAVDGWDADVIAEDHHMFFKCNMYGPKGYCKVDPIHLPMLCYAVVSMDKDTTLWPALYQRYQQAVRHSLGFGEIAYVMSGGLMGLLSPCRMMVFAYKLLHMHYFAALPAVHYLILNFRRPVGILELMQADMTVSILFLCLFPSAVILMCANKRLVEYLLKEKLIETPSSVHGANSYWSNPWVQTAWECFTFASFSSVVSVGFQYIPCLAGALTLLNMDNFKYVVAPKSSTGDEITVVLPVDEFALEKPINEKSGHRL